MAGRKLFVVGWALLTGLAVDPEARADWPQWGGSPSRNHLVSGQRLPADWTPGKFDRKTGEWDSQSARNIKWVARLGSQTFGTPVVAGGKILVGTNNSGAYLKRYPADVDLGCVLCFRESDGEFLWQFSAEKLPTGRVHDWPLQGIASSPLVEGDRAWFVSNRGEVLCVDTEGLHDGEDDGQPDSLLPARLFDIFRGNDPEHDPRAEFVAELQAGRLSDRLRLRFAAAGLPLAAGEIVLRSREPALPRAWFFRALVNGVMRDFEIVLEEYRLSAFTRLTVDDRQEADVVWRFDMMKELGSQQHNLATCCITSWNDTLFICTGNGVDESHIGVTAPQAPSFFAVHKHTAKVLWTSNLPGANVHHGQWSAPAVGMLGGVPQVIFCGGDGWVYSFHAEQWSDGRPKLLWKFDTNPKDTVLELGGRGTRNEPIAVPVLYDNKVYVTTGQDPEHGEGTGHIWCIDPTKKLDGSDVSPHKVIDHKGQVIPHRRGLNFRPWEERELYNLKELDRGLDMGVVEPRLLEHLEKTKRPLPNDVAVHVLSRGAEWELTGTLGDQPETLFIWKRRHVNQRGQIEEIYVAARTLGERIVDNPDSAAVWKYDKVDADGDGKIDFHEQMHRTIGSVAIQDDLLFCQDFSGLLHCLNAQTGQVHWTCDTLAAGWTTPLICDGRVYVADEDGDVAIFRATANATEAGAVLKPADAPPQGWLEPEIEINMGQSICCTPLAANGVLYIATKDRLFAIAEPKAND